MAATLPKLMVIKSNSYKNKGHVTYKKQSVFLGEPNVFSPIAKIEVERATSNDKYVHLRFSFSKNYWQRNENDNSIVAESDHPEEDTTKPSCTLFEASKVDDKGNFWLSHVPSGGRVLIDGSNMSAYVKLNPGTSEQGSLTFVDLDALFKLPPHVAFKGYDNYLTAFNHGQNYLKFMGTKAKEYNYARQTVSQMPDGHVRIKSNHFLKFWRRTGDSTNNWICCDSSDTTGTDIDTLFWPVKFDDNTVALKNAGNNKFCTHLVTADKLVTNCLSAADSSVTKVSKLVVEDIAESRKICNVRYQMEYGRVYDEEPYSIGRSRVVNNKDVEALIRVSQIFRNDSSYSFSRTPSSNVGVLPTTVEAGLPYPGDEITVSHEIKDTPFAWDKKTTVSKSVVPEFNSRVVVPAKSSARANYMGKRATFAVPFSYTQIDEISTYIKFIETEQVDGVYTSQNSYNFNFVVEDTQPISEN